VKKERPLGRPRPGCEDDMKTDLEGSNMRVCILEFVAEYIDGGFS